MTTFFNNKPLVIALEGIKGSGKSTLWQRVMAGCGYMPMRLYPYTPTAPAPAHLPVSAYLQAHPHLATYDKWQQKLYAERSLWHARQIPAGVQCIWADRSIATSYATRWYKWARPSTAIKRVDALHCGVPVPDYIIWLNCPPTLALERIATRPQRSYGLHHQTPESLQQAYCAYQAIMRNPPPRMAATQWIEVDAQMPLDLLSFTIMGKVYGCQEQYLDANPATVIESTGTAWADYAAPFV